MNNNNPITKKIYDQVVRPALASRLSPVKGYITAVYYERQTVDVVWKDPNAGSERKSSDLPLPPEGDGVFSQGLEVGDYAVVAFRHGSIESPYISSIERRYRDESKFSSKFGSGIPKGIGYL